MCLEIGNKVAVLDDVITGVVTNISGDMISVRDKDGMVYQFMRSELVKIDIEQRELTKYTDINNAILKEKLASGTPKSKKFIKHRNEVVMEVDLHIEKLIKSTKGLDNYDMLTLQIDMARRKLEYGIQKKIGKIVFIHGVGEGVLKTELQFLFSRYPVSYQDASYQKYGLGATEVYIYQNPK